MYVLEWKGEKNPCTKGWNITLVFAKVCFTLVLDLYFLNRVTTGLFPDFLFLMLWHTTGWVGWNIRVFFGNTIWHALSGEISALAVGAKGVFERQKVQHSWCLKNWKHFLNVQIFWEGHKNLMLLSTFVAFSYFDIQQKPTLFDQIQKANFDLKSFFSIDHRFLKLPQPLSLIMSAH